LEVEYGGSRRGAGPRLPPSKPTQASPEEPEPEPEPESTPAPESREEEEQAPEEDKDDICMTKRIMDDDYPMGGEGPSFEFAMSSPICPHYDGDMEEEAPESMFGERSSSFFSRSSSSKLEALEDRRFGAPPIYIDPRIPELNKKIEEKKTEREKNKTENEQKEKFRLQEIQVNQQKLLQLEQNLKQVLTPSQPDGEIVVAVPPKEEELIDFPKYPGMLDAKFEKLDEDSALRATIINAGNLWVKSYQKGLLSPPASMTMTSVEQEKERNQAFDLLDALTRSGAMPIPDVSFHVVLASTHCFDKAIVDTIIQDNMNPIEKLERSNLIVATTIHGKNVEDMVNADQIDRVRTYTPILFK